MFWWSVRAWSLTKSRRLGFGKVYGFAALEELREKFKVPANRVLIDSNFQPKGDHGVYAAALKYGWTCVRGDKKPSFTHRTKNKRYVQKSYAELAWGDPGSGTEKEGRRYAPLITFSKSAFNQKVQELIDNGHWEEPLNTSDPEMEKEYSQQMAARVRKTDYVDRTGETRVFWKESKNDHARDLANMNTLGAMLDDLVPDPAMERTTVKEEGRMQNAEKENA